MKKIKIPIVIFILALVVSCVGDYTEGDYDELLAKKTGVSILSLKLARDTDFKAFSEKMLQLKDLSRSNVEKELTNNGMGLFESGTLADISVLNDSENFDLIVINQIHAKMADLIRGVASRYNEFEKLSESEINVVLTDALVLIESNNSIRAKSNCLEQFDEDMQGVHARYDANVLTCTTITVFAFWAGAGVGATAYTACNGVAFTTMLAETAQAFQNYDVCRGL